MKRWFSIGFSVCLALAAVHCGGESGEGTGGSGLGGVTSVSKLVTAAEGGTLEASGAKIEIPAGALAADTTITVEVTSPGSEPDAASIASAVYNLGPETTFLKPVTLTFEFSGTAPEGKVAKIAYLEGGAWKPLDDSAVSGGAVVATTTHFSTYAVVWVAGSGTTTGGCEALQFDACGGSLEGEWDIVDVCVELLKNPLESCPGASISISLDYTVAANFGADATFALVGEATSNSTIFLPSACIGPTCEDEYMPAPGGCQQVETKTQAVDQKGTFAVSGTQVTLTQSGSTLVYDYCVNGGTAFLREVADADDSSFTILKLQKK